MAETTLEVYNQWDDRGFTIKLSDAMGMEKQGIGEAFPLQWLKNFSNIWVNCKEYSPVE